MSAKAKNSEHGDILGFLLELGHGPAMVGAGRIPGCSYTKCSEVLAKPLHHGVGWKKTPAEPRGASHDV